MTGTSKDASHPRRRRWRFAGGIALVEGVVVALSPDISRWTAIALAVAALVLYAAVGRKARSRTLHDILWIFACSQALAVVMAVLSFFFSWLAYLVAALIALVVLVLLVADR